VAWSQACSGRSGVDNFDQAFHQLRLSGMSTECPVVLDLQGSPAAFGLRWF
jgi:hypothetical protein